MGFHKMSLSEGAAGKSDYSTGSGFNPSPFAALRRVLSKQVNSRESLTEFWIKFADAKWMASSPRNGYFSIINEVML